MDNLTPPHTNNIRNTPPFTARQIHQKQDTGHFQQQKFTPASRTARINSWHQRMRGLFARQSY